MLLIYNIYNYNNSKDNQNAELSKYAFINNINHNMIPYLPIIAISNIIINILNSFLIFKKNKIVNEPKSKSLNSIRESDDW